MSYKKNSKLYKSKFFNILMYCILIDKSDFNIIDYEIIVNKYSLFKDIYKISHILNIKRNSYKNENIKKITFSSNRMLNYTYNFHGNDLDYYHKNMIKLNIMYRTNIEDYACEYDNHISDYLNIINSKYEFNYSNKFISNSLQDINL